MAKRKKVMVTGSGGFIFGNFIRQVFYSKLPYTISSIDRVRDSHIIHNIYVNADHSFHIADITDAHILHVIFEKERPDIVIHGAAETIDEQSMNSRNIFGTKAVVNECLKMESKLIYVSTDRVYGDLGSEEVPLRKEADPVNPHGVLATTKASGEAFVKGASGLDYNIIRLSNNYGPWQTVSGLIPHIIDGIFDEKPVEIYGTGSQTRDWTHVFDTCSAIFAIIENWVGGEIYNITSKQEFSNLEVVQIVCNALSKGHELVKHVERDFDSRYAMANDKIKALGWSPQFKFRDGIAQTCQWYLNNKYVLKM
ncbi:NAD-dependent epimerase/dehydratase family protein [Candidatus Pacearchaeota archaeon]|jgi:dTDP-glucose 4,6-dehydratase|nr:NAD-dependent epimerase/dehydratase family protein [Candidatus Pacearchaeota archaeon]